MAITEIDNIKMDFHPRCATCGCQDQFEFNEDKSFIKCTNCGREYPGGSDELLEYNQEEIELVKDELQKKVAPLLQKEILKELQKSLKKRK